MQAPRKAADCSFVTSFLKIGLVIFDTEAKLSFAPLAIQT